MRLAHRLAALGVFVTCWTAIAIPAHATYGARVTADEPQYLLSAISLGEDLDLDISDELAGEAYRPFHATDIDQQTYPLDDSGRQVSPHDPLLPLLLAGPMRLGGWIAAKAALAALAGLLAVLSAWTAIRRFGVRPGLAIAVVAVFACTAPLATYATQVYPEIPAALAVVAAVAALSGAGRTPNPDPDLDLDLDERHPAHSADPTALAFAVLLVSVVALPWLSIKYAPVAAALAGLALWRWRRRRRAVAALTVALAVAGATYLLVHRGIYGGWTAYASGDFFATTGEFTVVGSQPDYLGRSRRLVGLLVDNGFGIASWMIGWLALPFALGVVLRSPRAPNIAVLVVPLITGWLVATFVALTMHGWWWPGRQLVVVLPLGVIMIAITAERAADAGSRMFLRLLTVAAAVGAVTWLWTTIEAITRRRVLVVDFDETSNPWMRLWRLALPDGRQAAVADEVLAVAWTVAIIALGAGGWTWANRMNRTVSPDQSSQLG